MSLLDYIGGSVPRTPYQQERDVEDAMEGANALWNVQHNTDGTLKALPSLEVTGDSTLAGLTTDGARYVAEAVDVDLTGTTNNLNGIDGLPIDCEVIRFSASADRTLTGITPKDVTRLQKLRLVNRSSYVITLPHNSAGSLSANRFSWPGAADFSLIDGAQVELLYDRSSGIWRGFGAAAVLKSVQRGTITFAADGVTVTDTATLSSAVVMLKSSLTPLGIRGSSAGPALLELTNSTTVTATRSATYTSESFVIGFQVVEFY